MRVPGGDLPHIQYQLDDPGEYVDEHITVVGSGDAGIENALGLAADAEQGNVVTILNRGADFARAKGANVKLLMEARDSGRINVMTETSPSLVEPGWLTVDTRDGPQKIKCDRIIARMGSAAPRAFVESCAHRVRGEAGDRPQDQGAGQPEDGEGAGPGTGVEFTSADREAYPKLSPQFETTVPGIFVIGALAGYPLIKHCMNQGYDVVEFINGNTSAEARRRADPEKPSSRICRAAQRRRMARVAAHQRHHPERLSPLQMREFMLDSEVRFYPAAPSCSSATSRARRCSRSPPDQRAGRDQPQGPQASPCRSSRAPSSAKSA
jgi:cGMP-dependent protein kinase 2